MCDPPTASTPIERTKGCRGTPGHLSDTLGAVQTPHVCLPGIIAVHDRVCQRINEKNLLMFCQSNKASQIWMVTKKSVTETGRLRFWAEGYVADCGLYEWAAAKWGRPQLRLFFTGNNVISEQYWKPCNICFRRVAFALGFGWTCHRRCSAVQRYMEDKDTRVIGGKNIARSWVTWTIGTGQMCPYVGETTDYTLAVTCMEFKTTVMADWRCNAPIAMHQWSFWNQILLDWTSNWLQNETEEVVRKQTRRNVWRWLQKRGELERELGPIIINTGLSSSFSTISIILAFIAIQHQHQNYQRKSLLCCRHQNFQSCENPWQITFAWLQIKIWKSSAIHIFWAEW